MGYTYEYQIYKIIFENFIDGAINASIFSLPSDYVIFLGPLCGLDECHYLHFQIADTGTFRGLVTF